MGLSDDEVLAVLEGEGLNEPAQLPVRGAGGSKPHVSPAEARRRREVISQLLASGVSADLVVTSMAAQFGMTTGQTTRLAQEVRASWLEEDAEHAQYAKSATIRRHKGHIRKAASKGAWTAVAMLEKNLMQVEGTADPAEVRLSGDVRIGHALMEALGEMDPVEVRRLVEEEKDRCLTVGGVALDDE